MTNLVVQPKWQRLAATGNAFQYVINRYFNAVNPWSYQPREFVDNRIYDCLEFLELAIDSGHSEPFQTMITIYMDLELSFDLTVEAMSVPVRKRLKRKRDFTKNKALLALIESTDLASYKWEKTRSTFTPIAPDMAAPDAPYVFVESDEIDYAALCLAKCAAMGYQGEVEVPIVVVKPVKKRTLSPCELNRAELVALGGNPRVNGKMMRNTDVTAAIAVLKLDQLIALGETLAPVKPIVYCPVAPSIIVTPKPTGMIATLIAVVNLAVTFIGAISVYPKVKPVKKRAKVANSIADQVAQEERAHAAPKIQKHDMWEESEKIWVKGMVFKKQIGEKRFSFGCISQAFDGNGKRKPNRLFNGLEPVRMIDGVKYYSVECCRIYFAELCRKYPDRFSGLIIEY